MLVKNTSSNNINKEWNNQRKSIKITELLFIAVITILMTFGIICDIAVSNNIVWIYVYNFKSYILTLLGIQSTVSTLTIALVALISNNISESYMGVTVSDYYLNIRPVLFKQNVVIYTSFGLIAVSCIAYVFSWYNFLISLFAVTIMLIMLSSYEIYFLFRGLLKAKEEIELYISESLALSAINKKGKNKRISLISNFINDWSHKVNKQTELEYREYKNIFINAFEKILIDHSKEDLSTFKELCIKQICSCLDDDNGKIKARGIILLSNIYDSVWKLILNKEFSSEYTKEFNLFDKVLFPFKEALQEIPLNIIEKTFNWEHFTHTVSQIAFMTVTDNTERISQYDLGSILRLSSFIGYILKAKERNSNECFDNNLSYWGGYLSRPYLDSAFYIPEKQKEEYLKFKCKNYFYYCKGFIDNEYMQVVKENIFFRAISNSFYNIDKFEILYYLSIDCYLYYLAEKESTTCVDANLKAAARKLLEEDKNLNDFLFSKIDSSVLDYSELEKDLQDMLSKCEWYPKFDDAKYIIMDNVVREFYVFMQLLMNNSFRFDNQKSFKLKELPFVYINQFLEGNEANTKESIKRFYMLFQHDKSKIENDINAMYSDLENYLKSIYKNNEITEASQEQQQYLNTVDESAVIKSIQDKLKTHFDSVFGNLLVKDQKDTIKWTCTVNLFNYNLFTNMINEDIADVMYSDVNASLVANITNQLLNRNLLSKYTRKYKNDDEFIEFIRGYKTLMGSEYVFKNDDYKNEDMFDALFKNIQCIFYGFYQNGGIALNENTLKVNIKEVNVTIQSASLNDIDYQSDEQSEMLSYNVTNNIIIPFQKNELMVYIKNKWKMLNVSVNIEFIASGTNIGAYIIIDD